MCCFELLCLWWYVLWIETTFSSRLSQTDHAFGNTAPNYSLARDIVSLFYIVWCSYLFLQVVNYSWETACDEENLALGIKICVLYLYPTINRWVGFRSLSTLCRVTTTLAEQLFLTGSKFALSRTTYHNPGDAFDRTSSIGVDTH